MEEDYLHLLTSNLGFAYIAWSTLSSLRRGNLSVEYVWERRGKLIAPLISTGITSTLLYSHTSVFLLYDMYHSTQMNSSP